jgi:hypothetical protein
VEPGAADLEGTSVKDEEFDATRISIMKEAFLFKGRAADSSDSSMEMSISSQTKRSGGVGLEGAVAICRLGPLRLGRPWAGVNAFRG